MNCPAQRGCFEEKVIGDQYRVNGTSGEDI
jgi:hypothetical protein